MESILYQLSKTVLSAVNGTPTQRELILSALLNLTKLETRPVCLTKIVYKWCSVIYENRQSLDDWERLLLVCLEIGFRHLDPRPQCIEAILTHTEHHKGLADVVLKSQESEVIADLLHAWTAENVSHEPARALLCSCIGHLVGLHNLVSFPPRLRRLVIRSVEVIGYKGFEGVGVERFVGLLNFLHVTVKDINHEFRWPRLLLDTIQTSEGTRRLSHSYWELLVELAISLPPYLRDELAYSSQIMRLLTEAQECNKLECWIGIVWMLWPLGAGGMTEGDLGHSVLHLFRQQPGAVQKLEQWMERWSQSDSGDIPESFKRICKQAHETMQQDTP